jgi:hypothetical protein
MVSVQPLCGWEWGEWGRWGGWLELVNWFHSSPLTPGAHSPRQLLTHSLPLKISVLTCHINDVIQHLFFCYWFLSLVMFSSCTPFCG